MGQIIDGKLLSAAIKEEVKQKTAEIIKKGVTPKLVVLLVGEDPASQVYVRNKGLACEHVGMASEIIRLPADTREELVINKIEALNADKAVHGILVQLPLPKGLNEKSVLASISPRKDVDGLHVENMGKLFKGEEPLFLPCTPQGIMAMLLSTGVEIKGKEAVVIGRSNIVGKPIAILLLNAHATVTLCHSRTANLAEVIRRGDIVVAAVGKARLITGDMIKPGAVVIDVGMNKVDGKLCGDVDFASAKEKASYISPVPGGAGLMTVAMLLKNTLIAAEKSL